MTSSTQGADRAVVLAAVRHLVQEARAARAGLVVRAPEREFYVGVERAAEEILHPELGNRTDDWLARESAAFRSGYLKTSITLGTALTAGEPPVRLRLPEPE